MLMSRPIPITRDLVLVGGGHSHALVLLKWAMNPLPGVQLTVVNPHVKAPYTGMLPGLIAGHYERRELEIDLARLARRANARLVIDHATGLDIKRKRILLSQRPDIAYDTVSIDIGITTALHTVSGSAENTISAKPLGPFATRWEKYLANAHKDGLDPKVVIIGGGVAGVELALAAAYRLRENRFSRASVKLIESGTEILRETNATVRDHLLAELDHYNVEVLTGTDVKEITAQHICFASIPPLPVNFVIAAAGATPHAWLKETGLALHNGFIKVDDTLRSTNTPHVFASGDCAHLTFAPRPKAGVFAVRQAPTLFENLRADLSGGKMKRFRPQRSYLKLISMGQKSAIADKWGWAPKGPWIWRTKDKIDKAFMAKFSEPVQALPPKIPRKVALGVQDLVIDDTMQCGGCGSKVAQKPLLEGLSAQEPALSRFDDAAIIKKEQIFEVLSTDHLRAFTPDAWTLAKISAVHAMGDVWAMGAQPDTVLSHIILPYMGEPQQANMLREIMAGARTVFDACGAKIVGGHTSTGAELTIGFTVIGTSRKAPITVAGARAGDIIVLTKPLGTGILLAAEMRQLADGDDYQKALASMCRSQERAASLLGPAASSMTDVTGFGLAGHLMNILKASHACAHIKLAGIPVLAGAEDLSEFGVRSSLWPSNAALKSNITMSLSAKGDVLFDPQTCGGLLACVAPSKIEKLVSDFKAAGEPLWDIGKISAGTPHITVL